MNEPPPLFTLPAPVAPNWRHALGGVWRLTLRRHLLPGRWMMVLVGLSVLGLLCFASGQREARGAGNYAGWVVGFYVTFLVPALAFVSAAGAMRDELKSSTVDYVFTRPIRRPAFVLFKFASHTACAAFDFLLALAVVIAIGTVRGVPDLFAALPGFLFGQVLLVAAFGALGFLAAILTSRYIIVGLGYAGIVEVGLGQIPTQISRLSVTRQVRDLLDPAGDAASVIAAVGTAGAILLFTLLALTAAAALFHQRELNSAGET